MSSSTARKHHALRRDGFFLLYLQLKTQVIAKPFIFTQRDYQHKPSSPIIATFRVVIELDQVMELRTEKHVKTEVMMGLVLLLVVALLTFPMVSSLFRDTMIVEYVVKSVPVLLYLVAGACIIWNKKSA